MRPETLRRRVEVLRQRHLDAIPPQPVPVLICAEGESTAEARERAGVDPGTFAVIVQQQDMSVPRPEGSP